MQILLYIMGTLVAIIIVMKFFHTKRRHTAASNVLFAKYTFNKLNVDQQNRVHDKAIELVLASATKMRGFANEVERYGWYALALDALAIHSMVPDNPCWYPIKNPYSAITPGDSMLYRVTDALQKQYSIEIEISAKKGYPDKAVALPKKEKKGKNKSK